MPCCLNGLQLFGDLVSRCALLGVRVCFTASIFPSSERATTGPCASDIRSCAAAAGATAGVAVSARTPPRLCLCLAMFVPRRLETQARRPQLPHARQDLEEDREPAVRATGIPRHSHKHRHSQRHTQRHRTRALRPKRREEHEVRRVARTRSAAISGSGRAASAQRVLVLRPALRQTGRPIALRC